MDLKGGSDHGPFAAEGIPVGGLFSGAEGRKTGEQAEVYGGEAGVAYADVTTGEFAATELDAEAALSATRRLRATASSGC